MLRVRLAAALLLLLSSSLVCGVAANHLVVLAAKGVRLDVPDEHILHRQHSARMDHVLYVVDGHGHDNSERLQRQKQRLGTASYIAMAEDSPISLPIEMPNTRLAPLVDSSGTVDFSNWHLDRIDKRQLPLDGRWDAFAALNPDSVTSQVHAYVIDTGVYNHADFPSQVAYDFNYFDGQTGERADDCHGTHTFLSRWSPLLIAGMRRSRDARRRHTV